MLFSIQLNIYMSILIENVYADFPGGIVIKNSTVSAGDKRDMSSILGWEDPLEKEMATHSSIMAWRIPWTEEPRGLQSIASQRVGHD